MTEVWPVHLRNDNTAKIAWFTKGVLEHSYFCVIFAKGNNFCDFLFSFLENEAWPRGYKTFFVLNSVEHGILNAH